MTTGCDKSAEQRLSLGISTPRPTPRPRRRARTKKVWHFSTAPLLSSLGVPSTATLEFSHLVATVQGHECGRRAACCATACKAGNAIVRTTAFLHFLRTCVEIFRHRGPVIFPSRAQGERLILFRKGSHEFDLCYGKGHMIRVTSSLASSSRHLV